MTIISSRCFLTFLTMRRLKLFVKILTVSVLVIIGILSYIMYKKQSDWWEQEREWVEFLERDKLTKPVHLKPKTPDIKEYNKPLIIINNTMTDAQVEENFFSYLERKDIKCMDSIRLGSQHEGGYTVCMSPPFGLTQPCNVFSFGIKGDWNFDDAVSQIYKCTVYAFDPTEKSTEDRSKFIHFEKTGLGSKNGITHRGQMKTLSTYLKEKHLTNTPISYLKFDIEIDEWRAIKQMLKADSLRNIKQIGFEIHTKELLGEINRKSDYIKMYDVLRGLEMYGFRRFDHRKNPFGLFDSRTSKVKRSCCYELYYINMVFMSSSKGQIKHIVQNTV